MAQTLAAIIVTNQDHEANTGPWRKLAERGVEIREWKLDSETGHLPIEGLKALLDEKVKLVCFPHCSNIVGSIHPVRELTDLVHRAGAWAVVDGVSYCPHGLPDVADVHRTLRDAGFARTGEVPVVPGGAVRFVWGAAGPA
jgi:selenocysteine lyase/cysteine desulfurase